MFSFGGRFAFSRVLGFFRVLGDQRTKNMLQQQQHESDEKLLQLLLDNDGIPVPALLEWIDAYRGPGPPSPFSHPTAIETVVCDPPCICFLSLLVLVMNCVWTWILWSLNFFVSVLCAGEIRLGNCTATLHFFSEWRIL